MPYIYPEFQMPNALAVARTGENVLNARHRRDPNSPTNQLLQARADEYRYDMENPDAAVDPTSPMRNYDKLQQLIANGASPEQIATFKNFVRAQQIRNVGGVDTIIGAGGADNTPLSTLENELDAASRLSGTKGFSGQAGEQAARAGLPDPYAPVSQTELTLPPVQAPPTEASLAGEKETAVKEAGYTADYKWKGIISASVKIAEAAAKERGEVLNDLQRMEASLPALKQSVADLTKLATASTSTMAGKAYDVLVKEMGFGSTEGATAQAKFIAIVNNQVLPLLRQTFGAAFTAAEGESLKKTMGDPNASPEVKMAQLDAFITQKVRDIQSKKNQIQAIDETTAGDNFSKMTPEQLQAIIDE